MNKLTIVTLLVAAAAASTHVMADEAYPVFAYDTNLQDKTRAQVQAELQQARADGTIHASDTNYDPFVRFMSQKSRAQVRAELAEAQASGEYAALNADFVSPIVRPMAAKTADMSQMAKASKAR